MSEFLHILLQWLLLFVIAGLVFWLVMRIGYHFRKKDNRVKRVITWLTISLLHGLIIVAIVHLYFHDSFGAEGDNGWVFKCARYYRELGGYPEEKTNQPFILIDNSGNKMLVRDPYANEEDSINVCITDRRKLAELLEWCNLYKNQIALVVCDIRFDEPTEYDERLKQAIGELASSEQILLPGNKDDILNLQPAVYATAQAKLDNGKIAHFTLFDDEQYSLPYRMYLKTEQRTLRTVLGGINLEYDTDRKALWIRNSINPALGLYGKTTDQNQSIQKTADLEAQSVGYFLSDAGRAEFIHRLKLTQSRKPIVFIGEFENGGDDVAKTDLHETLLGSAQGSRILLDIYRDLLNHAHKFYHPALWLILLLFTLISMFIFRPAFQMHNGKPSGKDTANHKTTSDPDFRVFKLVKKEWSKKSKDLLWILLFVLCSVMILSMAGIMLNLVATIAYFLLLESLFSGMKPNHT